MAIIINPEDIIEKPNLVLSSQNQFSKAVYESIANISSNEYTAIYADDAVVCKSSGKLARCTTNINNVKIYEQNPSYDITYAPVQIYQSYYFFLSSKKEWTTGADKSFPLSKDNFEFNIFANYIEAPIRQMTLSNGKIVKYRVNYIFPWFGIAKNTAENIANVKIYMKPEIIGGYTESINNEPSELKQDTVWNIGNKLGLMDVFLNTKIGDRAELKISNGAVFWTPIPISVQVTPLNGSNSAGAFAWATHMNITIVATTITQASEKKSLIYGSDKHYTYTFSANPMINENTMDGNEKASESNANKVISRYKDGKHYGNLSIKIDKYYDSSSETNVIYDPSYIDKKYISVGETVRPYIYDINKNKIPLLKKNGDPVDFIVMSSKLVFNNGIMSIVLKIMEK